MFRFFHFIFFNSQIWLNQLMDGHHLLHALQIVSFTNIFSCTSNWCSSTLLCGTTFPLVVKLFSSLLLIVCICHCLLKTHVISKFNFICKFLITKVIGFVHEIDLIASLVACKTFGK
jgi:hypothetical protein